MVFRDKKNRIVMKGTIYLDTGEKVHYQRVLKDCSTLKEGRLYETQFKEEYNPERDKIDKQSYTFEEFIEKYDNDKSHQIKSTTKASNMYAAKHFESLYTKNIKSITSSDIKSIVDEKFSSGLSVGYCNKLLTFVSKIFSYGIQKGILSNNPVKQIPKYKDPDALIKDDDFYTAEEFKQLIQYFPRNRENGEEYMCFVIVNILYFMGLRFNEAACLTKQDINMKERTIRINKTAARYVNGQSYIITNPKTKNSIRTITMPDVLYELMEEYLQWYDQLIGSTSETFLFGLERPILAKVVRKRLDIAIEKSGINKRTTIHALRKSNASLLCNAGAPIPVLARRLGHTQTECLKTYVKFNQSEEKNIVEIINGSFSTDDIQKNSQNNDD